MSGIIRKIVKYALTVASTIVFSASLRTASDFLFLKKNRVRTTHGQHDDQTNEDARSIDRVSLRKTVASKQLNRVY